MSITPEELLVISVNHALTAGDYTHTVAYMFGIGVQFFLSPLKSPQYN